MTLTQCFAVFPARYVFVLLTSIGLFLVYAYKGFLGVAIVAMVRRDNTTESIGDECPQYDGTVSNISYTQGGFDWNDHEQATILGSYFYGYIVLQVPAGVFAELVGAKWMFGGSMLICALLSLLGPIAAQWGFVPFLITRILQGLAQGLILPCMNAMIARWMPKMERSRAISIILSGSAIGSVVTLPLTGYLCDETFLGGWPAIFYVLGIAGCVWFVLWAFFVFESPEKHPFISEYECNYILIGQGCEKTSSNRDIPWKAILTSYHVYALMVAQFAQGWGYLTILTLLPTYFTKILHMNIKTNGLISSLPYLCLALVSCTASYISDKIRERQICTVTTLRKVINSFAFFGPAICLIAVALSKCNTTLSIVFFVLAMGLNGCVYSGVNSSLVDMAPDFSAILMGITNSIGNIPGFIAPYAAANYYSNGHTLQNWSYVFYTCAAIFTFAQIIYILFSTSELQTWGISKPVDKDRQGIDNKGLDINKI